MGMKQTAQEIDIALAKLIKEQSKPYPRPIDNLPKYWVCEMCQKNITERPAQFCEVKYRLCDECAEELEHEADIAETEKWQDYYADISSGLNQNLV